MILRVSTGFYDSVYSSRKLREGVSSTAPELAAVSKPAPPPEDAGTETSSYISFLAQDQHSTRGMATEDDHHIRVNRAGC